MRTWRVLATSTLKLHESVSQFAMLQTSSHTLFLKWENIHYHFLKTSLIMLLREKNNLQKFQAIGLVYSPVIK